MPHRLFESTPHDPRGYSYPQVASELSGLATEMLAFVRAGETDLEHRVEMLEAGFLLLMAKLELERRAEIDE